MLESTGGNPVTATRFLNIGYRPFPHEMTVAGPGRQSAGAGFSLCTRTAQRQ